MIKILTSACWLTVSLSALLCLCGDFFSHIPTWLSLIGRLCRYPLHFTTFKTQKALCLWQHSDVLLWIIDWRFFICVCWCVSLSHCLNLNPTLPGTQPVVSSMPNNNLKVASHLLKCLKNLECFFFFRTFCPLKNQKNHFRCFSSYNSVSISKIKSLTAGGDVREHYRKRNL